MTLAAAKAATAKQRNRSFVPVVMGVEDFRIVGTSRQPSRITGRKTPSASVAPGSQETRSRRVVILTGAFTMPGCLDKTDLISQTQAAQ